MNVKQVTIIFFVLVFVVSACKDDNKQDVTIDVEANDAEIIKATFGDNIDLNVLAEYANQPIPSYITKDNGRANRIQNIGATLGRVLFYDKMLSVDNSVACASCHKQAFAFSDTASASQGVNGLTGRHSMRLVNARFGDEPKFFWDERANSLEEQTTMPIQDHGEMGYSGQNGDPSLQDLITKLSAQDYYKVLFRRAYGTEEITEAKMQLGLAQFIRSIQSFDSKFDLGRVHAANDAVPFSNYTNVENDGKTLFITAPNFDINGVRQSGGLGCAGCHRPPEFDIDPNSGNNGVITAIGGGTDITVTRSPSLRDLINPAGNINGLYMHSANFGALQGVMVHYNNVNGNVPGLDRRLRPNGNGQQLNLTGPERLQIVAFLNTLTGSAVYVDAKWSNPFEE